MYTNGVLLFFFSLLPHFHPSHGGKGTSEKKIISKQTTTTFGIMKKGSITKILLSFSSVFSFLLFF